MTTTLALFGSLGMPELIILGLLGLLIFGKRLPEVGKNLGKGIIEFKKGLQGVEEDVNRASSPRQTSETPRQLTSPATPTDTTRDADLEAENARLRAQLAEKNRQA
jgi:sec-independent protein translocase protein TatA